MGCEQYSPLVSRFLDDDLEKGELEVFLEHLFACERCREELKAFEGLRQGFQKAELLDAPPEPSRPFSLEDLGPHAHTEAGAVPLAKPALEADAVPAPARREKRRSKEFSWMGSLSQFIFPQNFLRYAVPMIAVLIVGIWIYPEDSPDRVDVRNISTSRALSAHLSGQDAGKENMDLYVMQHAANQPWAQYGSHVSMIRKASGSLP